MRAQLEAGTSGDHEDAELAVPILVGAQLLHHFLVIALAFAHFGLLRNDYSAKPAEMRDRCNTRA